MPTIDLTTLTNYSSLVNGIYTIKSEAIGTGTNTPSNKSTGYVFFKETYPLSISITNGGYSNISGNGYVEYNNLDYAIKGSTITISLSANSDYKLPAQSGITVTNGTISSYSGAGSSSGSITISTANTSGNLSISVPCEAAASAYNVTVSSNNPMNNVYLFDGLDSSSTLLGQLMNGTITVLVSSGYLYIGCAGNVADCDPGSTSGGVSLYEDSGWDGYYIYLVTGNGSISNMYLEPCIIEGTLVTLANGSKKKIEDIDYNDELLVWNFYEVKFDSAKPTWIMQKRTTNKYNLLTFEDGTTLGLVGAGGENGYHRIYNDQKKEFTHTGTDDTPIGTITMNENKQFIKLVKQEIVEEPVNYYNVITDKHYNLFANGILTSCRLSNKYKIENMKYVGEQLISAEYEKEYFDKIESIKKKMD